jgi:hypothetical protein
MEFESAKAVDQWYFGSKTTDVLDHKKPNHNIVEVKGSVGSSLSVSHQKNVILNDRKCASVSCRCL